MKIIFYHRIVSLVCVFVFSISCSTPKPAAKTESGQVYQPVDKVLYATILKQDSLLFEAFNARNFDKFKVFFAENLELYQDNKGLRNYNEAMDAFKSLLAMHDILTRTAVKGSFEVYPIKNYGAIQTGSHSFCHLENGNQDCGTFKFMNVWENRNGQWKITRLVTYDH